ncbi:MAG: hypothetical protein XU10_C0001G0032 [Chloroflexi bacterium CSP1-4]|nr:MAG: hypothetical protein XU10_C0001G0032 [Chloroflexi bacterium CSP1-4]
MRWLKYLLFINGVAFAIFTVENIFLPTSFLMPSDAPGYGLDAARAMGVAYLPSAVIMLGSWWMTDRFAIRLTALGALSFAVAFAVLAAVLSSGSSDLFHQNHLAFAAAWAVVALLYAWLLYRERSGAA